MTSSTAQVLDDMILSVHAKEMLQAEIAMDGGVDIVMFCKLAGASKLLADWTPRVADIMASELNLVRSALAQCDVPLRRQEEICEKTAHRVAVLFVGYVEKLSRGEPIDEEHAEKIAQAEKLKAAATPADKLRALADMLEAQAKPAGKYSA